MGDLVLVIVDDESLGLAYVLPVHDHVLHYERIDVGALAVRVLGGDVEVPEAESGKLVLVALLHVEEGLHVQFAVTHGDVPGVGQGDVLPVLQVEVLGPGMDVDEVPDVAGDVLHADVFI